MSDVKDIWATRLAEIEYLGKFTDGWDGCGTLAPGEFVARKAAELLHNLRFHAFFMGAPDTAGINPISGSIVMVWDRGENYADVEITAKGSAWTLHRPEPKVK